MCISAVAVLLYAILFSAVQSTVLQRLYVKPRMSSSKCKSRGDGAVATVLFKVLYCNIKNVFSIFYFFLYIVRVKSIINTLLYGII